MSNVCECEAPHPGHLDPTRCTICCFPLRATSVLPTNSKARKGVPVATGFMDYFPLAIIAAAALSQHGNDKHNPGEPLHWSREKSNDHPDCNMRHFLERYDFDPDDGFLHLVKSFWRTGADLQTYLEENGGVYRDPNWTPKES